MAIPDQADTIVGAESAHDLAVEHLIRHVGDLVEPGPAQFRRGRWEMVVTRGNVVEGHLGIIGHVFVDASTGRVEFERSSSTKAGDRASQVPSGTSS